jgi:hypothetical protein
MAVKAEQSPVEVIDGFKAGSELSDSQHDALVQLTKYGRIPTDRDNELPPYVRLVEGDEQTGIGGQDIVAIFDKASGLTGVVHRAMTGAVRLDEKRTARSYRVIGFKSCTRDEALQMVWGPQQAKAAESLGSLMPKAEEPF